MEKQNALQGFIQVVILNAKPLLDKSLQLLLLSLLVYCIIYLDIVNYTLFISHIF